MTITLSQIREIQNKTFKGSYHRLGEGTLVSKKRKAEREAKYRRDYPSLRKGKYSEGAKKGWKLRQKKASESAGNADKLEKPCKNCGKKLTAITAEFGEICWSCYNKREKSKPEKPKTKVKR